jgi:quinohemoprotein ethanol dehydrogenase
VFCGTGDGRILALDARSGAQLWESPTGNAVMGGPAIYSIDGQEYVAVMAGVGGTFSQDANLATFGFRYGTGRRLLAFRLGGSQKLPPVTPAPPVAVAKPVSSDIHVQHGLALYGPYCGSCHGPGVTNAGGAPDLRRTRMLDALPAILLQGALVPNGMPSFAKYLTAADVEDLKSYLQDRAISIQ